ncbi:single-stranded DNA-binding protein [Flavobacteriales bacterium]|jgi:single-strand DNA-binding protein|nr:single-stranded DNA-binding protein [Flavobacteriales bacterium]
MKNMRNKVQLIGNVGNDPELEITKNGKKFVKLSIATNNTYTNKDGEKIKDTQWHPVLFWGKKAEIAEKHIVKGQEIFVEGSLNYRNYEDDNGVKKYVFEIISNDLLLLNN